jgi:adenosylmethionine-8-amino-7-oxononanoate aminotransferase
MCDEYGALLILDEVMCGMGRIGSTHAWQQEGMAPDIQTVTKGLAGGYAPVSMLLMNQRVVDGLAAGGGFFNHGHTHGSHAVACAAALQVQKIIHRDGLLGNVNLMGKRLELALQSTLRDHPHVGDIRGRGLFWAVEFVEDKATKKAFAANVGISRRIKQAGLKRSRGISLYPGSGTVDGYEGDHVIISPPFNVTSGEIDKIVVLVTQVIDDVFNAADFFRVKAS